MTTGEIMDALEDLSDADFLTVIAEVVSRRRPPADGMAWAYDHHGQPTEQGRMVALRLLLQ